MSRISGTLVVASLCALATARAATQDAELAAGERFAGKIAYLGDEDRIVFLATAGTHVTVRVAATDGSAARPRVLLTDADGVALSVPKGHAKIGKAGSLHKLKRVPVSVDGLVEARVMGADGKLGSYELTVVEFLPETIADKLTVAAGGTGAVSFLGRAGTVVTIVAATKKKGSPLAVPTLSTPAGGALDLASQTFAAAGGHRLEIGPIVLPDDGSYTLTFAGPPEGSSTFKVRVEATHPPLEGPLVVEDPGHATLSGSIALVDGAWISGSGGASESLADGEVLVRLDAGTDPSEVALALGATVFARAPNGWVRLRTKDAPAAASLAGSAKGNVRRVAALVRRARSLAGVLEVQPNHRRVSFAPPGDSMYAQQWDFPRCRFEQAWSVTAGDSERSLAVLDTGVRFEHPDLAGRLLPGYDFVAEPWNAGDGGGIDGNPSDEFLSLGTHGTHVIGTIAAGFDNGIGVAGAVPDGNVLPVRVLGVLGGTDFDIAQGVLYAAGLPNASGKVPAVRADVINMSLGGPNPSEILHQALKDAVAAGVVVVAAAGNAGTTFPFYPAAYPEVIAVTATDVLDGMASYSSYGAHVDLAAPGGDKSQDLDQDGHQDGILSTIVHPQLGPTYALKSGTSMAAPHVAAAAFLLRSAVADLPVPLVRASLAAGAVDLGPPGFDPHYGYGRLDVAAALDVALGQTTGAPKPFFHEAPLRFAGDQTDLPLAFLNAGGGGGITVTDVTSDKWWLVPVTTTGTSPCLLDVHVEKAGLPPGTYQATLTVQTSAGVRTVPVEMEVTADGPVPIGKVYVLAIDVVTAEIAGAVAVTEDSADPFVLEGVPEGTYRVVAVTDLDQDGVAGESHDYAGLAAHPDAAKGAIPLPDGEAMSGAFIEVVTGAPAVLPGGGHLQLPEGL